MVEHTITVLLLVFIPRYVALSRLCQRRELTQCTGIKSPGPWLPSAASCVMGWKWRCGVGKAPARRRYGVWGA
jgi:hypothetical protein